MKKFLKALGLLMVLVFLFGVGYYFLNNEKLPEGKKGPRSWGAQTDAVAERPNMLSN